MSSTGLGVLLLGLAAAVWGWHASMAARERANAAAAGACERLRLQLLDGTVALTRLWPRRGPDGRLALERTYAFSYTDDGRRRLEGFVVTLGRQVVSVGLASARGAPPAGSGG